MTLLMKTRIVDPMAIKKLCTRREPGGVRRFDCCGVGSSANEWRGVADVGTVYTSRGTGQRDQIIVRIDRDNAYVESDAGQALTASILREVADELDQESAAEL